MAVSEASSGFGQYVHANGLDIYYETQGEGEPLLLIHGGLGTCRFWDHNVASLASHFRLVLPDSRGHGRTVNPSGQVSYQLMADDMAALIQALGLQKPIVGGYSDGGNVALELGIRYPDLARALIVGAAWYRLTDEYLAFLSVLGMEPPDICHVAELERDHPDLVRTVQSWQSSAPDGPEHWKGLIQQLATFYMTPLDYAPDDFQRVQAPALVLTGDRDPLIEDGLSIYRQLPDGELAVIPGAGHMFPFQRPELLTNAILEFALRHASA